MLSSSEVKDKQYVERIRGDLDVQDATDDHFSQIRSEDTEQRQLVDRKLVREAQKVFGWAAMLYETPQDVEFAKEWNKESRRIVKIKRNKYRSL